MEQHTHIAHSCECFSLKIKIWVCFHYFWFGLLFRGDFFFFSIFCRFLYRTYSIVIYGPVLMRTYSFHHGIISLDSCERLELQRASLKEIESHFIRMYLLYNTITDEASAITPKCHSRTHNCAFTLFITSFRLCNEKELNLINDRNNINNEKK